jgi:hypothetical protein
MQDQGERQEERTTLECPTDIPPLRIGPCRLELPRQHILSLPPALEVVLPPF